MRRALIILLALTVALSCACVTNAEMKSYNAGVAAYEAKDYASAKGYFLAANGYGNSKSYLSAIDEFERIYLEAVAFVDSREYAAAKNSFSAIEDFGNSKDFIAYIDRLEARYNEGLAAYEAEDYPLAKERFVQSQGWLDANDYVNRIDRFEDSYVIAQSYVSEGNYTEAIEAFRRIGANYRDSAEMIEYLHELIRSRGLTPVQLIKFYFESSNKAGDTVSISSTDINDTGFAATTSDELLMTGNTNEGGYITSVSFWLSKAKAKELGDEGVNRLFAHVIRALGSNEEELDSILEGMEGYLSGELISGAYRFSVRNDPSGFKVLSAEMEE